MGHIGRLDARDLRQISQVTIMHYERSARAYWEGAREVGHHTEAEGTVTGDRLEAACMSSGLAAVPQS